MKLLFAIAAIMICGYSCVKDEPNISIDEFVGKYLTCDSIRVTEQNTVETIIKGTGTGLDIMFDTAKNYIIYSNPEQVYAYRIRGSKIYYWLRRTDAHKGDFITIVNKYHNQLWLEYQEPASGIKTLYYYTAD